jgi:alpha-tubulin suppressor-like RCC1 family protein
MLFNTLANEYGQLGLGNTVSTTEFVKNEALSNMPIQNVYLAGWHGYVKHKDGTFYGIGYNVDGRLGNEGNTHVLVPTPLKHHLLGIHTIVCGGWHTLGLTGLGDVYIWGQQVDGNLGSYKRSLSFPRPILQGKGITKMFSGSYSTISVVQSVDKVYVWGREMESTPGASLGPVAFDKLNGVVDLDYVHCSQSDLVFTLSTKKLFVIKNVEKFADVTIFIY